MSEKLQDLKERLGEVADIGGAASVLGWDQQVNMPPGGSEARGQQLATLSKIAQEKFIEESDGLGFIDQIKIRGSYGIAGSSTLPRDNDGNPVFPYASFRYFGSTVSDMVSLRFFR